MSPLLAYFQDHAIGLFCLARQVRYAALDVTLADLIARLQDPVPSAGTGCGDGEGRGRHAC